MTSSAATGAAGARELIGRDRELARLVGMLDAALAGQCTICLVLGEAGIGKTRLADEVAGIARGHGAKVVYGEADARDGAPLLLWEGVVRRIGGVAPADPSLPAQERRWDLLDSLSAALGAAAPVLVVLEDLHWADESSLWILERLPRELAGTAVMFLATSRAEAVGNRAGLDSVGRRAEVVVLAPFGEAEVGRMAAGMGSGALDAASLHERTGGVPLLVRELLSMGDTVGLAPPAMGDLLRDSLSRVSTRAQAILWALAVAGPETPLGVVSSALGMLPVDLQDAIDESVDADVLVRADQGLVRFRHDLLRSAAAALRLSAEARRLHLSLARAWEAGSPALEGRAASVRHRLLAAPVGDPLAACQDASPVAAELARAGRAGDAVSLLGQAVAVAESVGPGEAALRATLLVELAALRWSLGEITAALDQYDQAALLAAGADDPELLAVAEVGASRADNMFVPGLERTRRLAEAEGRLPSGDDPLRARLLGRLAIAQMAIPDDVLGALGIADDAVEIARRLDDPEVLVDCLCDRHQVTVGPQGFAGRAAAVDEMIRLSHRAGRPELALRAYEWRFAERFESGDGVGARAAIERLDTLASVMPSPVWRFTALTRLHSLLHVEGDRYGADEVARLASSLAAETATPIERTGIELGGRISASVLWGRPDAEVPQMQDRMREVLGSVPNPFFQLRIAMGEALTGDLASARSRVLRYGARPDRLLLAPEGLSTLHIGAILVADLALVDLAKGVYDVLAPFAGVLGAGNGVGFNLPVDATLGRLALLQRRVDDAVAHHRDAVGFATKFPSPPLEARCRHLLAQALTVAGSTGANAERGRASELADEIGLVLDPASAAPPRSAAKAGLSAAMRRRGARWDLSSPLGSGEVEHSRGVEQLARVLGAAGAELAAVELAAPGGDPRAAAAELGPALDARAKREYRRRIEELRSDIEEAERDNDPVRAERYGDELETLLAELRRAVGLGGRDRPVGSGAERARVNVTRSLRRAIGSITEVAPALGAHLDVSVQTGRYCSYRPDPAAALTWTVEP